MKNLQFIEDKKLIEKGEPYRVGIKSVKEDDEIRYYWKDAMVFLLKENHRGWTFRLWMMNECIEVFFSRGNYEIVDL